MKTLRKSVSSPKDAHPQNFYKFRFRLGCMANHIYVINVYMEIQNINKRWQNGNTDNGHSCRFKTIRIFTKETDIREVQNNRIIQLKKLLKTNGIYI